MTQEEVRSAADNDFEIEAVDLRDELDFYKVYRAGVIYSQNHPNILKKDEVPISVEELKRLKACETSLYYFLNVIGLCPVCEKAMICEGYVCPHCGHDLS